MAIQNFSGLTDAFAIVGAYATIGTAIVYYVGKKADDMFRQRTGVGLFPTEAEKRRMDAMEKFLASTKKFAP